LRRTTRLHRAREKPRAADRRPARIGAAQRVAFIAAAIAATLAPAPGLADGPFAPFLANEPTRDNPAGLAVFMGVVLFATFTSILHLVGRRQWALREKALAAELSQTRARLDRANLFLSADPQIVVAWGSASEEPDVEGEYSLVTDAPLPRRVLGFGSWLAPELARKLDEAVERLRQRGEAFTITVASLTGRHFDVEGRAIAGRAVMRIRDISGDRLQLVRLRENHNRLIEEIGALRAMLDAVPSPTWTRDTDGRIVWVNAAYASAVEAKDAIDAAARGLELFDRATREAALAMRAAGETWRRRAPAVAAGERRMYDVVDVPSAGGSAGMASDLSQIVALQSEIKSQAASHARTLDQLSTGVAIFDRAKRLVFHNAAYRQIWALDAALLEQQPTDDEILDRLRAKRQLPEQADFRSWKAQLLAAYQAIDPVEHIWYIPDGRTLRAVTTPNPQGGVTYLFDDVTQRFNLESQFNALIRVQGETLDTLKEGVAVFGMDGRLKLSNPAFVELWRLDPAKIARRPHIDEMARLCSALYHDTGLWSALRDVIVGMPEVRAGYEKRIERNDGAVVDCAAMPLPDGATLITFFDVTAGVNVERTLTKLNKALMEAEQLRNAFIRRVSYELRSPLTSIIGFTQLLAAGAVGPLNEKQLEYAGHVTKSSAALLAIIDDILDLASIDAGALELRLEDVDVAEAMKAAAEGVQDRLTETGIELRIIATDGVGAMRADGLRVRQVLFNLLSNAIGFSEPGQTVTLAAMRRGDEIVFKVSDRGRGIPPDVMDRIFTPFETFTAGSRHRGVGLGLSIVRALVELHGGRVLIDSAADEGTTVTCIFPSEGAAASASRVA
jgi:signal transduction histidine kinase